MSITQTAPTAIEVVDGASFEGHYDGADGPFYRLQVELYNHRPGHINDYTGHETLQWTLDRLTSAPERSTGDFSIPLPHGILRSGDYCWRMRVQSVIEGPFTAWTGKAVFSKVTASISLDQASIRPLVGANLPDLRNLRFSATYANSGGYRARLVYVQMRHSGVGSWNLPSLVWATERRVPRVLNSNVVEVPFDGPGPLVSGAYEWRMWVVTETGESSNIVTGSVALA